MPSGLTSSGPEQSAAAAQSVTFDRQVAEGVVSPLSVLDDPAPDLVRAEIKSPSVDEWQPLEGVVWSIGSLPTHEAPSGISFDQVAIPTGLAPDLQPISSVELQRQLASLVDAMGGFSGNGSGAAMDLSESFVPRDPSSYWSSHGRMVNSSARFHYHER